MEEGRTVQMLLMLIPIFEREEIIAFQSLRSLMSQGAIYILVCFVFFFWCVFKRKRRRVRKYRAIVTMNPV